MKLWILPSTISRQSPSKKINHATHTKEFFKFFYTQTMMVNLRWPIEETLSTF